MATIGITAILLTLSLYFVLAAFVSRIRMRWGVGVQASATIAREGTKFERGVTRQPYMGAISCLGWAIFLLGCALAFLFQGIPVVEIVVSGFIAMGVGALIDWMRPRRTNR